MRFDVLYIQYTNPAAYPPLEHGSRLLADAGQRVLFLGIGSSGAANTLVFPPHRRVRVELMRYCPPGWQQKLHYLAYVFWVLWWVARSRPKALYCSDGLTAPLGLLAFWLFRVPVCYHEHDTPAPGPSVLAKVYGAARRRLACVARLCVLPNAERLARFVSALRPRRAVCVWNCPAREEVMPPRDLTPVSGLTLWFHGSLTPPQFPPSVVQALPLLPLGVTLRFAGYESIGHTGYATELLRLAERLGVADRVSYLGTPPSRKELYALAQQADVGLVLFDREFREPMAGASNKPFDYLACGLALLVTDIPEWEHLYVAAGCARSCDPSSPNAIAATIRWFLDHPSQTRAMGEAGRQRVASEWNYETQFRPVAESIGFPPPRERAALPKIHRES
jgi:glycosyltransferase involved in cell wall biosynthesis